MKDTPIPDEFRFFLSKHGLTGREAGALVGVNSRQIRRYTSDDVKVPYAVWYTLNMKLESREV
ncbi:MAG: hypothetical protein COA61_001920 [Zetaproteobacteria bacterium]|nr:hypothetical protein [Zetaproteobacteria bacterium]